MRIIGITGGVGCGKSSVMNWIAERYDAAVVEADEVAHLLMRPKQPCYQPIIDLLGTGVLREDGRLDRKKMADLVYRDTALLKKLNEIVHPAVKRYVQREIEKEKELETEFFFVEAALLIEDNYGEICDELWYIYTDEEIRRERLRQDRGYSDTRIDEILSQQLSEEEFSNHCAFEINNSGEFEDTQRQIEQRIQNYENV